jgi:hypothetical protein
MWKLAWSLLAQMRGRERIEDYMVSGTMMGADVTVLCLRGQIGLLFDLETHKPSWNDKLVLCARFRRLTGGPMVAGGELVGAVPHIGIT